MPPADWFIDRMVTVHADHIQRGTESEAAIRLYVRNLMPFRCPCIRPPLEQGAAGRNVGEVCVAPA